MVTPEMIEAALDAAHYYIDAHDNELAERGWTRADALDDAREKRAALTAALAVAPAQGVRVKPLDLSEALKHAFLSGVVAARNIAPGDECVGPKLWTKYEPYEPLYTRILSALEPAPVVPEPVRKFIYEAMRFIDWAAGAGISPVDGEPVMAPEDIFMAYSQATGDEDWETLADRINAMLAAAPQPPKEEG